MLKTKEDHTASFKKSLAHGGRYRTKVSTGMDWPDHVNGRAYSLFVKAVSDTTVTFAVVSADIDPRDHRGYNPLEHGDVEVFITDDIHEVIRTGIRGADPEFFDKYTPIPNREAFDDMRTNGISFSKGFKAFTR